MSTILVIEDEERIASFVDKGLRAAGYVTMLARDGATGLALARTGCDLVLLDLGLPDMDGQQVLEDLRGSGDRVPVIILTARDSVRDTVASLDGGANDYLTKPFQFAELLARVRLRLREDQRADARSVPVVAAAGAVSLDLLSRKVLVDGREADLTAREFTLLQVLIEHKGQVLSRTQLLGLAWDMDFDPQSNVVDVFVRALRGKVGAARIETVRGAGYRFVG